MAIDPAVLAARLDEAETALHTLLTGTRPVKVDTGDGRSVTYANSPDGEAALRNYIAELKAKIDPTSPTARRRPLRVAF